MNLNSSSNAWILWSTTWHSISFWILTSVCNSLCLLITDSWWEIIFQILIGEQPFLTKGPWARFFGDPFEVINLPKTEGSLFPVFLMISFIFNTSILAYKKMIFKKDSIKSKLNEILVGNFLNLITIGKTIFFIVICVFVSTLHRYIGQNHGSSSTHLGKNSASFLSFINKI